MSTNAICDAILISVFNKLGLRILDHISRLQWVAEVLRHSHANFTIEFGFELPEQTLALQNE
jgi:hypothetical protein